VNFDSVPDAPVSQFRVNLAGGARGLLINSEGLCGTRKRATVDLTGQNGAFRRVRPVLDAVCGRSTRLKRHQRRRHRLERAVR
jgi:hypothetical protein